MIAASVWMTWSILKPLGAWIWRWSADTTPVVSVRSSPNGLPIATVGSPTCTSRDEPSVSGCRPSPDGSIFSTARSSETSRPTILASTVLMFEPRTSTFVALATTWALVRIVPLPSTMKPEPVAIPCCTWGAPKS